MDPVQTTHAPAAIGPYSQGIVHEPFVFTSGQIGTDPATGTLVEGGTVAQAERALANVAAVVRGGGSAVDKIVKCTVFLKDMNDFAAVNAAYEKFFGAHKPARSTVQVARLPKDALIEIEAIAVL